MVSTSPAMTCGCCGWILLGNRGLRSMTELCSSGSVLKVFVKWSQLHCVGGWSSKGFCRGPRYKTCIHCPLTLLQSQLMLMGDAARKELSLQLVLCVLAPQSGNCKSSLPSLILTPRPAFVFHCSLLWDHRSCLECGVKSHMFHVCAIWTVSHFYT